MKTQKSDHKPAIDALEYAIDALYHGIAADQLKDGHIARRSIAELQMIRVAYMLADRNTTRTKGIVDGLKLCNCGAFEMDGEVLHSALCKEGTAKALAGCTCTGECYGGCNRTLTVR